MSFLLKKMRQSGTWKRIFLERLTEPMHLNIISIFILIFGSFRLKTYFDIPIRQHNAFALMQAADYAIDKGVEEVTIVEFGVAAGAGLVNLYEISERVRAQKIGRAHV